jgi:hypothetical protein
MQGPILRMGSDNHTNFLMSVLIMVPPAIASLTNPSLTMLTVHRRRNINYLGGHPKPLAPCIHNNIFLQSDSVSESV